MEKKNKSGKIFTLIGVVALCAGLVWLGSIFFGFNDSTETDDAQVEQYISF